MPGFLCGGGSAEEKEPLIVSGCDNSHPSRSMEESSYPASTFREVSVGHNGKTDGITNLG